MSDLARSRMAIRNEWNPGMDTISNHSGNASFTGGEAQICVPSLTWRQIGQQYSGTLNR